MKFSEKNILSSVALAIAALAVLWYMTVLLKVNSPNTENVEENTDLDQNNNEEKTKPEIIFDDPQSTKELPLNSKDGNIPNSRSITPTL